MIDLNLIEKKQANKVYMGVNLYGDIHAQLIEICEKEQITLAALIRHLINNFLKEYNTPKLGI